MFNWFNWFKPKSKEQWRLVKTISIDVRRPSNRFDTGKHYYHLFESNIGNRRVEHACTLNGIDAEGSGKLFDIYHEKIYRWEQGRLDPDIPKYDQVPEEDTINVLKGKI